MHLRHLKLCGISRCEKLERIGVVTAGDLLASEPMAVAKQLGVGPRAEPTLRRYRQSIKLAASVRGLMPREAMLLIAIHRRTVGALSLETAAMLHRDLERYALSSRGQKQLRGQRPPSLRRVRRWLAAI